MNHDDIYKTIENAVEKIVPPVVERVVNGKIVKLQQTLESHQEIAAENWEKLNVRFDELEPVADFLRFTTSFNRFLKWGGFTLFAFLGFLYVLFKKL